MKQKTDAPVRSCLDVGPGDYVKIGSTWHKIEYNSAYGAERPPREWTVETETGRVLHANGVHRYAKAEDLED